MKVGVWINEILLQASGQLHCKRWKGVWTFNIICMVQMGAMLKRVTQAYSLNNWRVSSRLKADGLWYAGPYFIIHTSWRAAQQTVANTNIHDRTYSFREHNVDQVFGQICVENIEIMFFQFFQFYYVGHIPSPMHILCFVTVNYFRNSECNLSWQQSESHINSSWQMSNWPLTKIRQLLFFFLRWNETKSSSLCLMSRKVKCHLPQEGVKI